MESNTIEYDGEAELFLTLDDFGSTVVYLPAIPELEDAPQNLQQDLETALKNCEEKNAAPIEEKKMSPVPGRRQWVAVADDRPLGWPGPRRWALSSWKLDAAEQRIAKIVEIRNAVEKAMRGLTIRRYNDYPPDCSSKNPLTRLQESFNTCLINRYPDGRSAIKWHTDDEKWYYYNNKKDCSDRPAGDCDGNSTGQNNSNNSEQDDMVIASISLGAERWFEFRTMKKLQIPKTERRTFRIKLKSGSLLVMAGAMQKRWEHTLPVDESCREVRYNFTFRRVMTAEESPILAQGKVQKKFKNSVNEDRNETLKDSGGT